MKTTRTVREQPIEKVITWCRGRDSNPHEVLSSLGPQPSVGSVRGKTACCGSAVRDAASYSVSKRCSKCGTPKSLEEFHRDAGKADGHRSQCKDCKCAYDRERHKEVYWSDPEAARAKERAYHGRNVEARREKMRRNYRRYPEKYAARLKCHRAIKRGELVPQPCELVPQPCEVCGDSKVEAHHDSYDAPLEVRWLCKRDHEAHHTAEHRRLREWSREGATA